MEKRAFLVKGEPIKDDDPARFEKNCDLNLDLVSEVAKTSGYSVDKSSNLDFSNKLKEYSGVDSFLFYFTGHANEAMIGDYSNSLDNFFNLMKGLSGEKIIILDACTEDYLKNRKFPKNMKVIGAAKVYDSVSLAKLLYDEVIFRRKDLEDINQETFLERGQGWIYVGESI